MARATLTTLRQRLAPHKASILVWFGAIGLAVGLFVLQEQRIVFPGLVQTDEVRMMATRTGRIETLGVALLDRVEKGQVVAILRDEQPREDLAVARAEIEKLQSELSALEASLQREEETFAQNRQAAKRRYVLDADTLRLKKLELQTVLGPDRIQLREMAVEIKAAETLAAQGLFPSLDLAKIKTTYDALAKKIQEQEGLLNQVNQDLVLAETRRDDFFNSDQSLPTEETFDRMLAVTSKAVAVQELKVVALQAEQAALILTAPMSGQITRLAVNRHEVVMPGQALLSIGAEKATRVLAYVPEAKGRHLKQGTAVELVTLGFSPTKARSQVTAIGESLVEIPARLLPDPSRQVWGRTLLIELPADFQVLPGEKIGIRML